MSYDAQWQAAVQKNLAYITGKRPKDGCVDEIEDLPQLVGLCSLGIITTGSQPTVMKHDILQKEFVTCAMLDADVPKILQHLPKTVNAMFINLGTRETAANFEPRARETVTLELHEDGIMRSFTAVDWSYECANEMIYNDIIQNNPRFSVPKRRITAITLCDRVFGTSLSILELTKAIIASRHE